MPDQRRITREIMRGWAPHSYARENGAPQPRAMALHLRHATQTFHCISRTLEGQPGYSRLPKSRFFELFRSRHGFSTSEGFNKEKVHQDWTSYHCQYLGHIGRT